jgi:hypothetical protein
MTAMPRMRRLTGRVLAVWLVSWLLLVLQPCCESVAGSLPHEHDAPLPGHAYQVGHDRHGNDEGHDPHVSMTAADVSHKHCDDDADNPNWLSDALPKNNNFKFDHKQSAVIAGVGIGQVLVASETVLTLHHTIQPPPSRRRTYLVTQRFRI